MIRLFNRCIACFLKSLYQPGKRRGALTDWQECAFVSHVCCEVSYQNVAFPAKKLTTEAQRTQRMHKEVPTLCNLCVLCASVVQTLPGGGALLEILHKRKPLPLRQVPQVLLVAERFPFERDIEIGPGVIAVKNEPDEVLE